MGDSVSIQNAVSGYYKVEKLSKIVKKRRKRGGDGRADSYGKIRCITNKFTYNDKEKINRPLQLHIQPLDFQRIRG